MSSWFLLLVVLAALAVAGVLYVAGHKQKERREAFEAMAARRGWSFTLTNQSLGRPAMLRLASRQGLSWTAQSLRHAESASGGPPIRTTEFESAEPRWNDDLLVIGPAIDPALAGMATTLLAQLDGPMMQRLIGRMIDLSGPEAQLLTRLRPAATDGTALTLSSGDPTRRVDLPALVRAIAAWEPRVSGDAGHPVVVLGPQGLRIRLRHGIDRADHMEAFVDYCLGIARSL